MVGKSGTRRVCGPSRVCRFCSLLLPVVSLVRKDFCSQAETETAKYIPVRKRDDLVYSRAVGKDFSSQAETETAKYIPVRKRGGLVYSRAVSLSPSSP